MGLSDSLPQINLGVQGGTLGSSHNFTSDHYSDKWIPRQHHGPKLRDHPLRLLKRPALVFFELFLLFTFSPFLSVFPAF
ncbi:hypothetical protein TNCV_4365701 [Trichonephila clavipes]|nr:hypothetical protein TNCV_4365701 [Trichonephila clavipes]